MSQPLANYTFYSWFRRGVSTEVVTPRQTNGPISPDSGAQVSTIARATFPITLNFEGGQSAGINLSLYGPGDVGSIDSRMVIRVYPLPDVFDAESNYFPSIEFDQPDFPWRYTPDTADENNRLRPWLVLIVLTDDEVVVSPVPTRPEDGQLPVITPTPEAPLPDLMQSWAWGHVQMTGLDDEDLAKERVKEIMEVEPHRALSRLVCARRLSPRMTYTAYLVPAFEQGRLAGLGKKIEGVPALTPAWSLETPRPSLPVYYQWRFGTGVAGDFESLVRLLRARTLPSGIGVRGMDVSTPLPGFEPVLPAAAPSPMELEGALMSPASDQERKRWPSPVTEFIEQLANRLNRPADLLAERNGDPLVAPPIYARWHAAQDRVSPPSDPSQAGWFAALNLDPRWRTIAGLGTRVVQEQQNQLMASAWEQVEGVLEINERMKRTQMAREVLKRIYKKHLEPLARETFLSVTAPIHPRVLSEQGTVQNIFKQSKVADGLLDPQFKRISRAQGRIGRRQGVHRLPSVSTILSQMNQAQIFTPNFPTDAFGDASSDPQRPPRPDRFTIPGSELRGIRITPDSRPTVSVRDNLHREFVTFRNALDEVDVTTSGRFRDAFADFLDAGPAPPRRAAVPLSLDLEEIKGTIVNQIDPEKTLQARLTLGTRLEIAEWVTWSPKDSLEPVMAAPEFDQPMYEALRDLSQEWLLPGVGQIPLNSVSSLVTNPPFIESFLIGLNHEMARELLWREYPTDQRGTYFRQFWDVRSVEETPNAGSFKDIHPLHSRKWKVSTSLGQHSARNVPPTNKQVVLVIRGEVLRRYPGTSVYGVKAVVQRGGKRNLSEKLQFPVFYGTLKPDLSFFGFNLTVEEARGNQDRQGQDAGWFFVLEEPLTELRFGLDFSRPNNEEPLQQWEDLSWEDLAGTPASVNEINYIDLASTIGPKVDTIQIKDGEEPPLAWHNDKRGAPNGRERPRATASDLAYITMQKPFRVAVHGSDMLIQENAERSPFHA